MCKTTFYICIRLRWFDLVVSMSASYAEGLGFAPPSAGSYQRQS